MLAPTTDARLSAGLKRAVVAEAEARRREVGALRRALDREAASLDAAADAVRGLAGWLAAADETPLADLGFDDLRRRHEALAAGRERCERLAADRQADLRATTGGGGGGAAVRNCDLVEYLYADFPVDHPVLSTLVRLDGTFASCQRAVRDHLVRRA